MSATYKILSYILLSRLTPNAEEINANHQCGLGCNRSTADHIFCIHQILQKKNRPDIFSKILNKTKEQQPNNEELQDKITLAYLTMKKKATKRKRRQVGSTRWEPELNEEVLLKCQTTSDAALGRTT